MPVGSPEHLPSNMDWPLTSETPLPHLSSVAYFHQPSEPSCSPPPRPVPPTPHRMKTYAMEYKETEAARHRKRYSAASAIPRPTSGTSRRATPLENPHVNISPDDEYVQAPPQPYRRCFHSTEGKPPSAWASSKARLPRSDSLLPYAQRPPQDLSGTKQQLQIRHYFTQSLSSPSKIGLPRDSSLASSSLPKSQSTAALSSPSRDVTPRRRLMKPLSPPLPKSQTFSNLSCTSFPATTPSPIKLAPTRMPLSVCSSYSQVNVVDALRESRMTEEEIMKWRQVQMEAAVNQGRLRYTFEIRQHKQKTPATYTSPTSSSFTQTAQEATVNLSANDYANATRLEEQRRKSAGGRPMFINSVLPNPMQTDTSLSSPNTIASTASVRPEREWESNLKLVNFKAEPGYWTGRYMSICDRLRTESMRAVVTASPKTGALDDIYRSPYDSADARRMNDALEELRGYCRTEDALQSFEAFEAQLRKNTNLPARVLGTRTSDAGSDFSDEDAGRILRARLKTQRALQAGGTPISSKRISRIPTPIKVEPRLPSIFGRLALTKSKTTGNLATLSTFGISNLSSPKLTQSSASRGAEPKSSGQEGQFRRTSGAQVISKAQEPEAQDPIMRTNTSRSKIESNTSKPLKRHHLRQSSTTNSLPHLYRDTSFTKVDRDSQIAEGTSCGTIESGHNLPAPKPRSSRNAEIQVVGTEKVIGSKSRRKPDRQSSGEIVRGFLDAGFSQVKKMGRRVGGSMSWAGSAEDLNAVVGGNGNGGGGAR